MKFLGAALFLFLVLGLGGCARTQQQSTSGPSIMSKTGPISESDLGVPIYPNAKANENESFQFHGNAKAPDVATTSASLVTSDSVDQVETFYREKLGQGARMTAHESGGGKLVDIQLEKNKRQIHVQIAQQASGSGSVIVILTQARP